MKSARVISVDDESDVRDGLDAWLSTDYQTVAFESAESFLTAIHDFDFEDGVPTCMLLDFQMLGMDGVALQSTLKQINIEFPIIFMSGNAKQGDIINAWHGGAIDFILKPFTAHQVSHCLKTIFSKVEQSRHTEKISQNHDFLNIAITQREAQVLLLLGQGYQQSDVALKLGISVRTVKMYRNFLKNKLQLNTLMELARYCDKHRISIRDIAGAKFSQD